MSFQKKIIFAILLFLSITPVINDVVRGGVFAIVIFYFFIKGFKCSEINFYIKLAFVFLAPLLVRDLIYAVYDFKSGAIFVVTSGLVLGYIIASNINKEDFFCAYKEIMYFYALISVVLFAIFLVFPGVISYALNYSYRDTHHYSLVFLNILQEDGLVFRRNTGIASEPGVYQYFLNLAYLINIRSRGLFNLRNATFITALLTTESTVGIFVGVVITFWGVLKKGFIYFVVFGFLSMPFLIDFMNSHYERKILNEVAFDGRFYTALNSWALFSDNLTGIGSDGYVNLIDIYEIGSFDSYSQVAVKYGIPGLVFLFISFSRVFKADFVLFLLIFCSCITNPFWFMPLISCFYFMLNYDLLGFKNGFHEK
jgi:hypothetical protein